MWPFRPSQAPRKTRHVKRGAERFQTDMLATDLGEVVDISGNGLRLRAGARVKVTPGSVVPLTIRWSNCRVAVKCRVTRSARLADGGTDVAGVFVGMSPRLRATLEHLGRFGFAPGTTESEQEPSASSGGGGSARRKSLPDYYRLLGVAEDASAAEIKQAYYRLAQQHHPDASNDQASAQTFQALAEAYRVLRDAESRRRYDENRAESASAA